jgi:putative redox protein
MIVNRTSRHSVVATPAGGAKLSTSVRDHTVVTDQPLKGGGTDTAPTPLELLSVALASCIGLYVSRFCEDQSLDAADVAVEVKPFWREDRIGRFEVLVHIPDSVPAHYHDAIGEVARKCPVHHTLAHAPEMVIELREQPLAGAVAAD